MKVLSVGINGTTDNLRERLTVDCMTLIQDGFRIAIDEIDKGGYTFVGCNIIEGELSFRNFEIIKNAVKNHVAKILSEIIVVKEEKTLVKEIIDHNYYYFTEEERQLIFDNTIRLLSNNNGVVEDFGFTSRRNKIFTKIVDYLEVHHELVVEGFIKFRLKEYRNKLVQIVDIAVDDFMLELEYKEFIRVLKYFVEIQEPRVEEVHVIINSQGQYKILDNEKHSIDNEYLTKFITAGSDKINYEDMLITALITIAPYNILVHTVSPTIKQNLVQSIKNIFEGRVIVCDGCDICKSNFIEDLKPNY